MCRSPLCRVSLCGVTEAFGCEYCADETNHRFGHLDQVATHATESALLLRYARCGSLYVDAAGAVRGTSATEAARAYGWAGRG